MGDPSVEVTEEQMDAAQLAKSKAVDAISQGKAIHDYLHSTLSLSLSFKSQFKLLGLSFKLLGLSFSLRIEFF